MTKGWKYYNHAMISTAAPHLEANLEPLCDGSIWKNQKGYPVLARWTSDFDCKYETSWWYLIKDTPIVLEELAKHSRKDIRNGLKRCDIRIINPLDYLEELYECSHAAFKKYKNATNEASKEDFIKGCEKDLDSVYWAGFDKESNKLIGFFCVKEYPEYIAIITAKFDPFYLKTRISDALYFTVINYYLVEKKKKYVDSGQRNINHITNTQDYKERTFGYRKAYCKLNIKYRFPTNIIVKILFPFRYQLDKIPCKMVHLIVAVLKMEEIHRSFNNA